MCDLVWEGNWLIERALSPEGNSLAYRSEQPVAVSPYRPIAVNRSTLQYPLHQNSLIISSRFTSLYHVCVAAREVVGGWHGRVCAATLLHNEP